jgi:hypothetical protein
MLYMGKGFKPLVYKHRSIFGILVMNLLHYFCKFCFKKAVVFFQASSAAVAL